MNLMHAIGNGHDDILNISTQHQNLHNPLNGIEVAHLFTRASPSTVISRVENASSRLEKGITKRVERERKRKLSSSHEHAGNDSDATDFELEAQGIEIAARSSKKQAATAFEGLRIPDLIFPKSAYQGHNTVLPVSYESDVLQDFIAANGSEYDLQTTLGNEKFLSLDLEDFCVYRPFKNRIYSKHRKSIEEMPTSGEMVQLHEMIGQKNSLFYFDGTISCGRTKRYVQKVPFEILSIGGYEDTNLHTVGDSLWIQSRLGRTLDVWYCLRKSASEYKRFYEPFLWMADFAKHLVDYMHDHKLVSLVHLRRSLPQWLQHTHGTHKCFQQWLGKKHGDTDYRGIAAAHASFLFNQAAQLDPAYAEHPLWDEIDPGALNAIPLQVERSKEELEAINGFEKSSIMHKTVVTSYVYKTFEHLPFAKCFEVVQSRRNKAQENLIVHDQPAASTSVRHREKRTDQQTVCTGDVVAVRSDLKTKWKSDEKMWYGYVQGTKQTRNGQKLDLIWLYRPSDTPCQVMRYPHRKELFLSDHCNCGDHPIYAHEAVYQPRVAFFGGPDFCDVDFFVRQKYNGNNSSWVTLEKSHFHCDCGVETPGREYSIGDTLLVTRAITPSLRVLEPVVLTEKAPGGSKNLIRVRLLQRLGTYIDEDVHIEPNELVYTGIIEDIQIADVHRSCHVRFYTKEERDKGSIPAPYCRQGTADCFYITHGISLDEGEDLKPLMKPWPSSFNQGWDPSAAPCHPILSGLDIFCGGGNLGRGLEEGGAVQFKWAVDNFKEAIHTYKANVKDPNNTQLFYGSVNDFLRQAMEGRGGKLVAQAGEVEVISAGSPCQGFSIANQRKGSDRSLLNVSMVASVVSYVDFYRPKYAFLENVLGMAKCGVNGKTENVFAQVICALVGMGYQVRPSTLDAWSFGSPQSRTRLFISIAAPGLTPLTDPPQSHSHPGGIPGRSLGKTANGLPLGSRYWDLTPFEYVTIGEATRDLPVNADAKTTSISFPDHRVTRSFSALNQTKISCVPRFPRGMSFVKAARRGLMPPPQMEGFDSQHKLRTSAVSRSWQRVNPEALISTVTTCCQPEDGISGSWVHWNENRTISVMEVRRAQGFPDHEVIVGSPTMQWKIIGNSVARPVALALGMSLRAAWLANGPDAPSQLKFLRDVPAVEEVIPRAAVKLNAIVNAYRDTKEGLKGVKIKPIFDQSLGSSLPSSTDRHGISSLLARSPPLPVRISNTRLVSPQTSQTLSKPPRKKRKLEPATQKPLLSSGEIITIPSGSDSDSETLESSN